MAKVMPQAFPNVLTSIILIFFFPHLPFLVALKLLAVTLPEPILPHT